MVKQELLNIEAGTPCSIDATTETGRLIGTTAEEESLFVIGGVILLSISLPIWGCDHPKHTPLSAKTMTGTTSQAIALGKQKRFRRTIAEPIDLLPIKIKPSLSVNGLMNLAFPTRLFMPV
jgi:hypothetical protein